MNKLKSVGIYFFFKRQIMKYHCQKTLYQKIFTFLASLMHLVVSGHMLAILHLKLHQ